MLVRSCVIQRSCAPPIPRRSAMVFAREGPVAVAYHCRDFDWLEHSLEAAPIVAKQEELARSLAQQHEPPSSPCSSSAPIASHKHVSSPSKVYEGDKWDEFYQVQAKTTKFFKERRYLLLEFPVLAQQDPPQHMVELGCGYGASLMPILKVNPTATVTGTDISPTCVQQLIEVAAREGVDPSRIKSAFVADSTDVGQLHLFQGLDGDCALIMFTLSAVVPEQQLGMLANAYACLKPGGLLLIRDHGLYDMVQLRITPEQWVAPCLYKRGDGTLAYFFSTQDLEQKAAHAGFVTKECKYVTVYNKNRKTGLVLKRVFVHGVFQKPFSASADGDASCHAQNN